MQHNNSKIFYFYFLSLLSICSFVLLSFCLIGLIGGLIGLIGGLISLIGGLIGIMGRLIGPIGIIGGLIVLMLSNCSNR